MSISSTTNRVSYTGNGATDTYSYTFYISSKNDLRVTVRDTDGVETTLTVDTHYTVSGVGESAGGNIALVNGAFSWLDADGDLKSSYILVIRRVQTITQTTDIRNQGEFFPETHEDAFDHFIIVDQQQQDALDRSVKLPETVTSSAFDPTLPTDIGTANSVVATNDDADGFVMGPTIDEISNAQSYATAAASSASAASTSASNASSSASAASASAAAAQLAASSVMWNDVVFITSADSPYTVSSSHRGKLIAVDATSGAVTMTLPQISSLSLATPYVVGIKKTDASGNAVTVNRSSSDTIDGGTSKVLISPDGGAAFVPDTDTSPDEWTTAEFGAQSGNLTVDRFSGNGATTAYTLSVAPGTENNTWVYISGVYIQKNVYSVSGTTLSFDVAPASGTNNIEVIIGTSLSMGTPSDGTVTTAKIVDSNVTTAKIAASNVTTEKIADSNVTTAKINNLAVTTAKIADANVTEAKCSFTVPSRLYHFSPSIQMIKIPVANSEFTAGALTSWTTTGTPSAVAAGNFCFGYGAAALTTSGDKISQTLSGTNQSGGVNDSTGGYSGVTRLELNFVVGAQSSGGGSITGQCLRTVLSFGGSSYSADVTVNRLSSTNPINFGRAFLDIGGVSSTNTITISFELITPGGGGGSLVPCYISGINLWAVF